MKINLDLPKLIKDGRITREEADRLIRLSKEGEPSRALSILFVMAAIAIALGVLGLNAQLFADFIKFLYESLGNVGLHLLTLIIVGFCSYKFKSGFLAGITAFVILSLIGFSSFYTNASYFIAIREPALTVLVFSVLGFSMLMASEKLEMEDERLALIFARTCMIIVNMGFWIGSLWGSNLGARISMPRIVFTIGWAIALIAVFAWGAKEGRRFVINTAAVFGAIHFYTQWFHVLGASPGSLLIAGLIACGILYGLQKYNKRFKA